jgi:prepilin-type N-terminal cleavage/methylation domain-containing protein
MHHAMTKRHNAAKGFTLSELLIALAILGLIATFTIPKVLTSVGEKGNLNVAKEVLASITQAYDVIRSENNGYGSTAIKGAEILNRMNYVETVTSAASTGVRAVACTNLAGETPCIKLHNGAVLQTTRDDTFATQTLGTIAFNIYPDGGASGSSPAPLTALLTNDGRLITGTNVTFGSNEYTVAGGFAAAALPTWFTWG